MSLQLVANHLAQKGRGPDSTLVHMSNREVAGLQALAKKHGGQLSVNPDTGLPEAGFLDNILPMVAGAGLSAFTGIDPITSAAIVGGITALDSKDLSKGLVAGLGAYGGAGMAKGLATLGGAESLATATPAQYGAGYDAFTSEPMQSLRTLGGGSALKGSLPILAGLAPAAAEAFDEEDEDKPPEQHKGYIRKYALDPVTGQYKQVGVYEAGGDPNVDVSSKAGTAGAFGAVGQSEYEAAQGMAAGGTATDSERIYDYLMGRGSNPMQFTSASRPRVDYTIPKPPELITPTTPILEEVYDQYGNRSGGGMDAEQRAEQEKAYNTPQDYLSIDRYDPDKETAVKDVQSQASLAAMRPEERAMHMHDVRLQSPNRTAALDLITGVGVIPIGAKIIDSIMNSFLTKGISLAPSVQVEDYKDFMSLVDPARQAAVVQRSNEAANRTYGGEANNSGRTGRDATAGDGNDRGQYGSVDAGYTGGSEAADGGLATPYGMKHMAHGGIANLYNLGSYSDGGRLLKGPGDGVSDDIPATIGNGQPARLADGEFVIPARIVSELGNGSTDAGARELYKMMDRIQAGRRKTVGKDQVAKNSKSARHLPA